MEREKYIPTVAYLGPEASFTHVAADYLFDIEELVPHPTIPDCIEAVSAGKVDYAIVPLENALEGSVPLTIDYLYQDKKLFINAELSIPIEQHLMVNKEQRENIASLESVQSHPHALAQCHKYLLYQYRKTPQLQTTSTAAAAKFISENPDKCIGAIGNRLAAQKYDLHIAEENIHDFHFNHTRFVILSLRRHKLEKKTSSERPKTTFMVQWPEEDRSGKLHKVLSVFAWRNLNLSKIESRPLKTGLGNYFFIIDVLEDETKPMMKGAREELEALNCTVRSFGTYYSYDM